MPIQPSPAAAVLLVRRQDATQCGTAAPADPALFLVTRAEDQRFLGGFHGFPGGRRDAADSLLPVEGASSERAADCACGARELFEETGVLVARGLTQVPAARLEAARADLLAGRLDFAAVLETLGARLDAADFGDAGRWVTPEYVPIRFDTRYLLAELPPGQEAHVIPGELSAGEWLRPCDALARWRAGTALLPTPVLYTLGAFGDGGGDVLARLQRAPAEHAEAEQARLSEVLPALVLVPLATPTLPPAIHTNCYLVGARELAVVDPGTPYPEERAVLDRAFALLAARGRRPREVLLTHHHPDHVGAAAYLRDRYRIPVAAHALTAQRLQGQVAVDRLITDGEIITLAGDPPRRLRALWTPGHAPGHLALFEEESGALLCGDLCATLGFVVIAPDDGGDMAAYLAALERVRALGARLLLPAHGLPTRAVAARLDAYLEHRRWREQRVLAAVARAAVATEDALLPVAYDDTPEALWPLARHSLRAHLLKLAAEGKVVREGERWRAGPRPA